MADQRCAAVGAGGLCLSTPVVRTPQTIAPVAVAAHGLACAAGVGLPALAGVLRASHSALQPNDGGNDQAQAPLPTWIGRIPGLQDVVLPSALRAWDCRATRAAWLGLQADGFAGAAAGAIRRFGPARVGLVLGTSASTIGVSEMAYRALTADGGFPPAVRSERLNTLHAVTAFVQDALGLQGPAVTVSTACSSSAKAFAQGERWLRLGLVDAVVVGGVDALSDSLLFGFNALQLVSPEPCRPFDAARNGISVAEAAGFALLLREADVPAGAAVPMWLLGHGESNDAHHMSSPHPQALGAELALDAALARAGLAASDVGYLNLHGTASVRNDSVEAALVARRFGGGGCGGDNDNEIDNEIETKRERRQPAVHASATKGATGHTMGAAGIVEALVCLLALRDGLCAGSVGTQRCDPALGHGFAACLQLAPAQRHVRVAASHSFGFGGNNCVLVFGYAADAAVAASAARAAGAAGAAGAAVTKATASEIAAVAAVAARAAVATDAADATHARSATGATGAQA